MPDLKPIKCTLQWRTHADGKESVWPDFRAVYDEDPSLFDNMLPSYYFDRRGIGWHVNKVDNLGTGAEFGEAVTAVPPTVADALIARGLVDSIPAEPIFAQFFDQKAHAHEQDIFDDGETLQTIAAKRSLGIPEDQDDIDALDPDNPKPGRRRNADKRWADYKAKRNIRLV